MAKSHPNKFAAALTKLAKIPVALLVVSLVATAGTAEMTAGTGRAQITPTAAIFPIDNGFGDAPFAGVHDALFARALVLKSNGATTILIVTDTINLPDDLYEDLVRRIAERYHVARERIWLTATHVHTVPWTIKNAYRQLVIDGVLEAVAEAMKMPEAVTIGSGAGAAFLNINRDEQTPKGFILGQDPSGASDKTVRVTALFRANGAPKAILVNYAVHAVVLHSSVTGNGRSSLISADLPGATNAFLDAHYPGAMAFWTSGAAGDQNPIMMSYYAEPSASGMTQPTDLRQGGFMLAQRWGQNLGLEVIRVVNAIKPAPVTNAIRSAQTLIFCPTKAAGGVRKSVRVSTLGIGPVNLVGISGELNTAIDRRLRERTSALPLVTLTLNNGYSGYLPDDASYTRGRTFEVEHSSFTAGCLEAKIVDAVTDLLSSRSSVVAQSAKLEALRP